MGVSGIRRPLRVDNYAKAADYTAFDGVEVDYDQLKQAIDNAGIPKRSLATGIGVSEGRFLNWFARRTRCLSVFHIHELSLALQVPWYQLTKLCSYSDYLQLYLESRDGKTTLYIVKSPVPVDPEEVIGRLYVDDSASDDPPDNGWMFPIIDPNPNQSQALQQLDEVLFSDISPALRRLNLAGQLWVYALCALFEENNTNYIREVQLERVGLFVPNSTSIENEIFCKINGMTREMLADFIEFGVGYALQVPSFQRTAVPNPVDVPEIDRATIRDKEEMTKVRQQREDAILAVAERTTSEIREWMTMLLFVFSGVRRLKSTDSVHTNRGLPMKLHGFSHLADLNEEGILTYHTLIVPVAEELTLMQQGKNN